MDARARQTDEDPDIYGRPRRLSPVAVCAILVARGSVGQEGLEDALVVGVLVLRNAGLSVGEGGHACLYAA